MLKFIFIFCVIGFGLFAADQDSVEAYYKNPGYTQFVEATKEFAEDLDRATSLNDRQQLLDVGGVFIGHVINAHPDYFTRFVASYDEHAFSEQVVFLCGMVAAGKKHPLIEKAYDLGLQRNLPTLEALRDFEVTSGADLDLLWVCFFATGDAKYLKQMLEVLNRGKLALIVAYELRNRELLEEVLKFAVGEEQSLNRADMYALIAKKEKEEPGFLNTVSLMYAAQWSLESHAEEDPAIKEMLDEIVRADPDLDYWKKIEKALEH